MLCKRHTANIISNDIRLVREIKKRESTRKIVKLNSSVTMYYRNGGCNLSTEKKKTCKRGTDINTRDKMPFR